MTRKQNNTQKQMPKNVKTMSKHTKEEGVHQIY